MARWGRYITRLREAGLVSSLRILGSRAQGFFRWPACLLARGMRRHIPPAALCLPSQADSADLKLILFWAPHELSEKFEALRGAQSEQGTKMVIAGDRVLREGLSLLGWGSVSMTPPIPWHEDSRMRYSWPKVFHKRIDILQEGVECDVKFPWELSRLQVLPILAQAWAASGEVRFLEASMAILSDWSRENPTGYGVNWTCSMEVAIRAINLGAAANLLQSSLTTEGGAFIRELLRSHERHLRGNLELSEVNGNHLFFDYLGIALMCLQLDGPDSAGFRKAAMVLAEETHRQFHGDGVHLEHATSYHRLVLEGILLFIHASKAEDSAAIQLMRGVAERAWAFLDVISLEDGSMPAMGDDDSGNVLLLGASRANHGGGVLGLAAALGIGRPRTITDEVVRFWFAPSLGHSCGPIEGGGESERAWRLHSFEEAGYFVIRGHGLNLILRAGPSGLHGRGSHDHNDQLSLVLSHDGMPILVDPGTRTYTESINLHQLDISTARHNTLSLSGLEQAPIHRGSVTCVVRSARGFCDRFEEVPGGPVAWAGRVEYGGSTSGLTHHRQIEVDTQHGGGIVVDVMDRLDGMNQEGVEASLNFMLAPNLRAELVESRLISLAGADNRMIQVEGVHPWVLAEDFVSSEYGGRRPTIRITTPLGSEFQNSVRFTLAPIGSTRSSQPGMR